MGNKASAQEAKGAGKDVIKQTQKSSNELYEYVDLNGGGKLVEAFRKGQARKDFTEVEELIDGFRGKFLYNDGVGKDIEVKELVQWRNQSRDVQEPKEKSIFSSFFTSFTNRVEDTIETVGTDNYALTENTGKRIFICFITKQTFHITTFAWNIRSLGCLGCQISPGEEGEGWGGLPYMDISHTLLISGGRVGALSRMYMSHKFFIGMVALFQSENRYRLCLFWSEIGYGFLGNSGYV